MGDVVLAAIVCATRQPDDSLTLRDIYDVLNEVQDISSVVRLRGPPLAIDTTRAKHLLLYRMLSILFHFFFALAMMLQAISYISLANGAAPRKLL